MQRVHSKSETFQTPLNRDVQIMKRLDKHPEEGYLMRPCLITDKPSSQQVEVLFLLNGHASKRHYGQVTQFFRPIGWKRSECQNEESINKRAENGASGQN